MAFRGNPNAGAADPQFLNFLFSRQNQKAKEERQLALDRLKAGQDYEDEKRKRSEFEMNKAIKLAEFEAKHGVALSALQESRQTAESNIAGAFGANRAANQATEAQGGFNLPTGVEGPELTADIASNADETGPIGTAFQNQQMAPVIGQAERISRAQQLALGQGAQSPDELFAQAENIGQTEERIRKRMFDQEVQKAHAIANNDVTEIRRIAADERIAERQANADVRNVGALRRAIDKEAEAIGNAKTLEERGKHQRLFDDLEARKRQKDEAMTPESMAARTEANIRKQEEHRSSSEMRRLVREMIARRELLGASASISAVVANVGGFVKEINGEATKLFLEAQLSDRYSKDQQNFLRTILIQGKDPDTQADIQFARLTEMRLVWVLENLFNPNGRTAIREIENIRNNVTSTGIFTSQDIAVARLTAIERTLSAGLFRGRQDLITRYGKGTIQFTDDDDIVPYGNRPPPTSFSTPRSVDSPLPNAPQGQNQFGPSSSLQPTQDQDGLNPEMFKPGAEGDLDRSIALKMKEQGF